MSNVIEFPSASHSSPFPDAEGLEEHLELVHEWLRAKPADEVGRVEGLMTLEMFHTAVLDDRTHVERGYSLLAHMMRLCGWLARREDLPPQYRKWAAAADEALIEMDPMRS